jgi:DNA polymerase I-like protein with 3'-5' exonuclease and polymerase domains
VRPDQEQGGVLRDSPHAVTTLEEIDEIVRICTEVGAFAFDVETRGVAERHPDVLDFIEDEWKQRFSTLKATNTDVLARSKAAIVERWTKELAVDPLRNEVFWIGIATEGRSWAIPMGHRHGGMLTSEEVGDGSTVPPPGYRKILANGKESAAKARYYIPAEFSAPPEQLSKSEVFAALEPLFTSEEVIKIGHNIKFDARSIRKYLGNTLPARPYVDTMVMQHIVNENLREYSLTSLIHHNFSHDAYHRDGKLGSVIDLVSFDKAVRYVHLDARWTWLLYRTLSKRIASKAGLANALDQDMETLYVLMHMEDAGIPVAKRQMKRLGKDLDTRMRDILLDMSQYAPLGFNPDSVVSKRQLLFSPKREGGLALKPTKKTPKGQASVDDEVLEALRDKHPIIPLLLDWQECKKLKSTYVDSLLTKLVDSRLHPSFHLHRAATGRLSSSHPNLQNIPRDSSVRGLFVAPEGYRLLVFDYDQIELRVMCMYSQDPKMSEFFINEADIHAGAAALCLNKPVEDVTPDERQLGKGVNFLTAYGGGPQKLARVTGITEDHARYVIRSYYKQFSGISRWKSEEIIKARRRGYVTSLSGRRRRLPDLGSSNDELRSRAERQAINAIIQGSAADICKIAMIDTHEAFRDTGAHLLVQVHDELIAACPEDKVDEVTPIMIKAMGHGRVIEGIPLKVSGHSAVSWSEAKGK